MGGKTVFRKKTIGENTYHIVVYASLTGLMLICLLPFLTLIAKSLSKETFVLAGKITFWPRGFNTIAYQVVFASKMLWTSLGVSVHVAVVGSLLNTLLTAITAYAVSRKRMPGARWVMLLYIITMFINGGLIPTYLILKATHFINKIPVLYVPFLVSPFTLVLLRNHYLAVPESLEESAMMDGASNLRILFVIMIPLVMPTLSVCLLFGAVYHWNDFFSGLIYITDRSKRPLQLYLRSMILQSENEMTNLELMMNTTMESVRAATVIVATLPILMVYPFLQKHFVKGVITGSVKE
jgi:putative aldouronate transport system permease protein